MKSLTSFFLFAKNKQMDKTTKKLFALFAFLPLIAVMLTMQVGAADEETVTATVTAENLVISVTPGSISYGTIGTSSTKDTTDTGTDESQTASNDGNVTSDFNMKGYDSASWGIGDTAGSESYTHKYCNAADCDGSPAWTALGLGYSLVYDAVAASGTHVFDLEVGTPVTTSDYDAQTVNIMVQVTAD